MESGHIRFLMIVALFFIVGILTILHFFDEYAYCPYTDCNPRYYGVRHPLKDFPMASEVPK